MTTEEIEYDAYDQLNLRAIRARHDGTPLSRVDAARMTLLGMFAPPPEGVRAGFKTEFNEIAGVAISEEGKVAFVGLTSGCGKAEKVVVVYDPADGSRTRVFSQKCHCLTEGVELLHFPEGSEVPAFVAVAQVAKTGSGESEKVEFSRTVHWGDWFFRVKEHNYHLLVSQIRCFMSDCKARCLVVTESDDILHVVAVHKLHLFTEAADVPRDTWGYEFAASEAVDRVTIVRLLNDVAVIKLHSVRGERIVLHDLEFGDRYWGGNLSTHVLDASLMETDCGVIFLTYYEKSMVGGVSRGSVSFSGQGDREYYEDSIALKDVYCCPGGNTYIVRSAPEGGLVNSLKPVPSTLSLYVFGDADHELTLRGVREVYELIEIPGGVAFVASWHGYQGRFVGFALRNTDGTWAPNIIRKPSFHNACNLFYWHNGLTFEVGSGATLLLCRMTWEGMKSGWIFTEERVLEGVATKTTPLHVPFGRLVPTKQGAAATHFAGGYFTDICYLW